MFSRKFTGHAVPPGCRGAHAGFLLPVGLGQLVSRVVIHAGSGVGDHRQRCSDDVVVDPRIGASEESPALSAWFWQSARQIVRAPSRLCLRQLH